MTSLRHNALVYDSQNEYVARSVAFLRDGLRAGDGAVVANTRPGIAVMREALGSDAGAVTFVDVSAAYTRPARTLAAYHRVYASQLRKTPALRAVADVQFGGDPGEWDMWTGYEGVFNRTFGHLPAWVMCTYNANKLPDPVLDGVWRTHPDVLLNGVSNRSDRYADPAQLLRQTTPDPTPIPDLRTIPFGRDIEEFRERLARELIASGGSEAKLLDALVAATELARNAIEYGNGIEEIRVGLAEGRFVCEIVDRGDGFDDPTAGYLAPRAGVGSGLWVARQLTWRIEFFRSPNGFTTRMVL
jgi:anti-sigma regulatory factor (Ser/Thr protein kinase)